MVKVDVKNQSDKYLEMEEVVIDSFQNVLNI
jgi:hypothetical protein